MEFHCRIRIQLLNILFLTLFLNSALCTKVNNNDSDRDKRTIGVLFRSFVDAFQPHRQQAPTVHSFQPHRHNSPRPQSAKADLLSSSKNLFLQKKNPFKHPSTQAPDTELIKPPVNVPAPVPGNPSPETQPLLPQAEAFHGYNQPQVPPLNPPAPAPLPSFPNLIPPPGHHPLTPFRANILFHPFQAQQDPRTSEHGFGLEQPQPQHPSPFNFQAEIYLHPPEGGVFPAVNQYPVRYSPINGWHDVSEILSKGGHVPNINNDKEDGAAVSLPRADNVELASHNVNNEIPEATSKQSEIVLPTQSDNNTDDKNNIEGQKSNSPNHNYFDVQTQHSHKPLFTPNFQDYGFFNLEPFGNPYGLRENKFLIPDFGHQNYEFQFPIDEAFKKFIPEELRKEDQSTVNPQSVREKNQIGIRTSLSSQGESGSVRVIHDYAPQREGDKKYEGNLDKKNNNQQKPQENEHKPNQINYPELFNHYYQETSHQNINYQQSPQGNEQKENQIHHSQQEVYNPFNLERSLFENFQYPTKIGRLPDSLFEYQFFLPPNAHNPHQAPPVYDSYLDHSEQHAVSFMDGPNHSIKRTNNDEKHTTKNCNCKTK